MLARSKEFSYLVSHLVQFSMVKLKLAYNSIFRKPLLSIFVTHTSIMRLKIKTLALIDTEAVTGNQKVFHDYYLYYA